ncbi:MAG: L,D-transpeptidase [Patescibacteria group bacterium]|nr:L,D-transpeptidase [Patescibacteria group bacterium]MDE2438402.1 L,D-transpeptidase [Patescibacteria group bacterium]
MRTRVMLWCLAILFAAYGTNLASADTPKKNDVQIEINLAAQTLTYHSKNLARSFHCSTGKSGHRTPKGDFKVYAKERHAVSYKYGNTPMPFTLWFLPAGYGIHASTSVPNHPASHGCVRLHYQDAKWLFYRVPVGTLVHIR